MPRLKKNVPRMSMAFYDDHLEYCRVMAMKNNLSITQYVNQLIAKDKASHDPAEWKQQKQ